MMQQTSIHQTTPKRDAAHNTDTGSSISATVVKELTEDINHMLSFAIYNGIIINTEINTLIQSTAIDDLINAHNLLCKNIAPATPKSIQYTQKIYKSDSSRSLVSKLPLIRNLIILALVFLTAFIITGLSPEVNNDSLDKGIMENNGINLLLNLGFLTSISGLGVLFYLLKNVSSAIKNGTLAPEDSIYYTALIVLGVIAGIIFSEIISFYKTEPGGFNLFSKSVLALIGGFSSDAIFSILQGIIERIKIVFIPSNPS